MLLGLSCRRNGYRTTMFIETVRTPTKDEDDQAGRVYLKTGRTAKPPVAKVSQNETKPQATPDPTLPSWQLPSDTSLFSSSVENSSGFSDIGFEYSHSENSGESESTSGQ